MLCPVSRNSVRLKKRIKEVEASWHRLCFDIARRHLNDNINALCDAAAHQLTLPLVGHESLALVKLIINQWPCDYVDACVVNRLQ
jgi:hypothetical protein